MIISKEFKISSKNQVTIPEKALKRIGVSAGDSIYFKIEKDRLEIIPTRDFKISALELGKYFRHLPKKKVTLKEIDLAIKKGYKKLAEKNK